MVSSLYLGRLIDSDDEWIMFVRIEEMWRSEHKNKTFQSTEKKFLQRGS